MRLEDLSGGRSSFRPHYRQAIPFHQRSRDGQHRDATENTGLWSRPDRLRTFV